MFLLFAVSVVMIIKDIFKKKNQLKYLKNLELITNMEEYQKTYNHD